MWNKASNRQEDAMGCSLELGGYEEEACIILIAKYAPLMVTMITHKVYTREVQLSMANGASSDMEYRWLSSIGEFFHQLQFRGGLQPIGSCEFLVLFIKTSRSG